MLPLPGAQVQSLVGEPASRMVRPKKNKNKREVDDRYTHGNVLNIISR